MIEPQRLMNLLRFTGTIVQSQNLDRAIVVEQSHATSIFKALWKVLELLPRSTPLNRADVSLTCFDFQLPIFIHPHKSPNVNRNPATRSGTRKTSSKSSTKIGCSPTG
jgi:hypothetical protein